MTLDEHVAAMDARICGIATWKAALFYASCSERFFPLYVSFTRAAGWGSATALRQVLDSVWRSACSNQGAEMYRRALDLVLAETPHADDFDVVETTFAQGVSVLLSAGLRSAMGERGDRMPIDAAYEILRVASCVELTGFLDLGDDPRSASFEASFLSGSTFTDEVALQEYDLKVLANASDPNTNLDGLRARACRNAYSTEALLPTQGANRP